MAENYKHLYEQMKKMVTMYQDKIVPGMREQLEKRVEVVRCKDCKHFGGHGACHCHAADENGTPIFVRENDFCSYGERREGG